MQKIPLATQTMFAELIQRCLDANFDEDFDEQGQFVKVSSKGNEYWYFQKYQGGGRTRRYVGPVAEPEITGRVERFRDLKADFTDRREIVRALSAVLPQPDAISGDTVEALSKAGLFRLRGVLVGSLAFQSYSGLLGVKLPAATIMTQDADFAQFKGISDAVEDSTPPLLDVLRCVDPSFREIPDLDPGAPTAFINKQKYKVEFLTPNRGSDDYASGAASMPALGGVGAKALRYLDFLIQETVWSVLLHKGGIAVRVPPPARYAIHKLIVSTVRDETSYAKSEKDLYQATTLIEAMSEQRKFELGEALVLAEEKGPKWSAALKAARSGLDDKTLKQIDDARSVFLEAK